MSKVLTMWCDLPASTVSVSPPPSGYLFPRKLELKVDLTDLVFTVLYRVRGGLWGSRDAYLNV